MWKIRYPLPLRNVEDLLHERGIASDRYGRREAEKGHQPLANAVTNLWGLSPVMPMRRVPQPVGSVTLRC
jgi:hypothetical protein